MTTYIGDSPAELRLVVFSITNLTHKDMTVLAGHINAEMKKRAPRSKKSCFVSGEDISEACSKISESYMGKKK